MPLFNPDKIVKLVSEMRKAINRLRFLKTLDKGLFLNDPDKIGSAKYNFIVAINLLLISAITSYHRTAIEFLRTMQIPFRL